MGMHKILSKSNCSLTELKIDDNVTWVDCRNNQIKHLELPLSIEIIDCEWNLIETLQLQKNVKEIECDLLKTIDYSDCKNCSINMIL